MSRRAFQFRLETIRSLRKDVERTMMRELAGELARARQLRRQLLAAEQRLAEAQRPAEGLPSGRELASRQTYLERVERERDEARERLSRQEHNVELAQLRLAEAARERGMLDRLEQRRRSAHEAEMRRVEGVEGNEISIRSHLRAGVSL